MMLHQKYDPFYDVLFGCPKPDIYVLILNRGGGGYLNDEGLTKVHFFGERHAC